MKARYYAQALQSAFRAHSIEGKDSVLVASLLDLLKRRGHQGLLASIIRELKKSSHTTMRKDDLVLTLASKSHEKRYEKKAKELAQASGHTSWTVAEDATIIGGFTLGTAQTFIDRSYKRQLTDLFKKIT